MRNQRETLIAAGGVGRRYLSDLWRFRELFLFLAWRDLLVRYKQTVIGIAWSVLRPLATMAVLTLVFGRLGKMSSGDVPYPLLVLCGVLPWQFFAAVVADGGNSLISNSGLISKIYFPRLIIPASALVTAAVDFLISLVFLGVLMLWYGWSPPVTVLLLPVFMVLLMILALGIGIWVSALTIRFRDFRVIVPFAIQLGLYLSPVGFASHNVDSAYRTLYSLNPMVGVIDGFRWCLLGGQQGLYLPAVAISAVVGMVVFAAACRYFVRVERTFADVI
jgi:lipopolysaccharide transport system permease protein